MSKPSYRALHVALRIFSVLLAIGALFMIFGTRGLVIRVFLHPPEAEVSTLLLFLLKKMGGIVLVVSAMLFLAARDPERNVAVVNGLIVGLVVLAVTPSAFALHRGHPADLPYPPRLGAFVGQASIRGVLLLSTTARGAVETGGAFLKHYESVTFCHD